MQPSVAAWGPGVEPTRWDRAPSSGSGLVLVVSIAWRGPCSGRWRARISVVGLAEAIATRLICAADFSDAARRAGRWSPPTDRSSPRRSRRTLPEIDYEIGMSELPVDFRSCRGGPCAKARHTGAVRGVRARATRRSPSSTSSTAARTTLAGAAATKRLRLLGRERRERLRAVLALLPRTRRPPPWSDLPGGPGAHDDDWEGYQVRIGAGGTDARATSHHGYDYRGGPVNWPSDVGVVPKSGWGEATGHLYVSDSSHAGHVYEPPRLAPLRGVRTATRPRLALSPRPRSPIPASGTNGRFASRLTAPTRPPAGRPPPISS